MKERAVSNTAPILLRFMAFSLRAPRSGPKLDLSSKLDRGKCTLVTKPGRGLDSLLRLWFFNDLGWVDRTLNEGGNGPRVSERLPSRSLLVPAPSRLGCAAAWARLNHREGATREPQAGGNRRRDQGNGLGRQRRPYAGTRLFQPTGS